MNPDDDERERWLRDTIAETGWAVVAVTAEPAHAFTIGLWQSYGQPELVMFGLDPPDMQTWLNACVMVLRARPVADDQPFDGVLDGFSVLLRTVHPSWHEPLFETMCAYYGRTDVPVRQVVWPDRDGRWPWEEGATESSRDRQPRAWLPVAEHPEGGWRFVGELAVDWPFAEIQPDTVVLASDEVVTGLLPVVAVTHDADGGWDFLDERGYADEAAGWVHFGRLYRDQPWLARFAELPADTQAWLAEDGQWRERRFGESAPPASPPAESPPPGDGGPEPAGEAPPTA